VRLQPGQRSIDAGGERGRAGAQNGTTGSQASQTRALQLAVSLRLSWQDIVHLTSRRVIMPVPGGSTAS